MLVEEVGKLSPRERFLYWIRERHAIYLKRRAGKPAPWTNDHVLQTCFFTNPYREHDKVTEWFRLNVRDPLRDKEEVVFATIAFRWFSWIPTGELLLGGKYMKEWDKSWPRTNLLINWDVTEAADRLTAHHNAGNKVFTGAFMINNSNSRERKVPFICKTYIEKAWQWREELLDELKRGAYERKSTMEGVHELLSELPGYGGTGFMAYEVVCDLRYTWVLEHAADKTTWCNMGPGAMKGLNRILGLDLKHKFTKKEWAKETQELLKYAQRKLRGMPPLEMREVEHSLCETAKYEAARLGDARVKRRYNGTG